MRDLPPRLVFHLGDFKTGTTVLQHWLSRAPGGTADIPFATPPGLPHLPLVHSLNRPDARPAAFAPVVDLLRALPEDRIVVVSAEHFEFAGPVRLKEAIAQHLAPWAERIRLVAYVRPHTPALLSRYAESTKIGSFDGTPADFLAWPQTVRRMTYAPRFTRWREAFGDAFTLRLYDRARLTGGDIRRDFTLTTTGADPGVIAAPLDSANDRLGVRHLALARLLHRTIVQTVPIAAGSSAEAARWTLGRHIGRLLAETESVSPAGAPFDPGPSLSADRPLTEAIAARFAADAAALDAAFFADMPAGPLTHSLTRAKDTALATAPMPDPETLLSPEARAIVTLWAKMLAHPLTRPEGAAMLDRLFHENDPV